MVSARRCERAVRRARVGVLGIRTAPSIFVSSGSPLIRSMIGHISVNHDGKSPMSTSMNITQLFYSGSHLHTVSGATHSVLLRGGVLPLAELNSTLPTGVLATDQNGSAMHAVNSADQLKVYTPYGYHRAAPSGLQLVAFNGERLDPISAGYPLGNGYRLYSPALLRYLAADSLSPFDIGGINPYCYVLDDPINKSDPSGRAPGIPLINKLGVLAIAKKKPFSRSLTIQAHGGPGEALVGSERLGAAEFNAFLQENGVFAEKYKKITLCMCYSASTAENNSISFGQTFANFTGRPIKAFDGIVFHLVSEYKKSGKFEIQILKKDARNHTDAQISVSPDVPFNYRPKIFMPIDQQKKVRQD